MKPNTYDKLLDTTIGVGWYQVLHLIGFSLFRLLSMWQYTLNNFIAAYMGHWCRIPELDRFNESMYKMIGIPLEMAKGEMMHSKCSMYAVNFSAFTENSLVNMRHTINATTMRCNNGWIYDTSTFESTVMSQYDLVCGGEYLSSFTGSAQMLGLFLGAFLSGQIADRLGRIRTCIVWLTLHIVLIAAAPFSPHYILFLVLRTLSSMAGLAAFTSSYICSIEILSPQYRNLNQMFSYISAAVLVGLFPLTAYFIRNHITFQVVSAAVIIPGLVATIITPESGRWFLSVGDIKSSLKVTKIMAKINRRKLPSDFEQMLEEIAEEERKHKGGQKATLIDLLKTPRLRRNTLLVWFIWIACVFGTYAFRFNIGSLVPGNVFLNMFLVLGTSVLLALPLKYVALYKTGRRQAFMAFLIGGGVLCAVIIGMLATKIVPLVVTAAILGVSLLQCAFGLIYLYSGEIFPTPARASGLGAGSSIGRLASLVTPQIPLLGSIWFGLPYLIMAIIPILAGIAAYFLPETRNQKFPETLEEGEYFGTKEYEEMFGIEEVQLDNMQEKTRNRP